MKFNHSVHTIKNSSTTGIFYTLCIFLFSLAGSISLAQNANTDFQSIDKTTYLLYTQKNWDSLIQIGNQALKSGVDYFYLRQRIGIAWYEKENYFKAVKHFEKALKFNASDATTQEYLYYSYIFSNRTKEARVLSGKFNSSLANKLQTQNKTIFEKIYVETGPTFSNNIDKNKIQRSFGGNGLDYQEQDLNDDKYYVHAGFEINLSQRISAYLGYSFLTISKLKQINTQPVLPPGNNNFGRLYNYEYNLFQNEFYGNMKFLFGKGFIFTPAYHLINVKYNTIHYNPDQPPPLPNNVSEVDTSFTNHIISMGLNKNISIFQVGLFTSWSNLNNKYQYQFGGLFTWYPKGNLNLYTTTSFVSAWEDDDNRINFDQLVGGKAAKKLWIEGYVTFGEMVNYNERNAFIVQNSGDKIKFRTGLNFIVLLSEKMELSFRYIYLQEEGYRIVYSATEGQQINSVEYKNNTIIGGIKWTF